MRICYCFHSSHQSRLTESNYEFFIKIVFLTAAWLMFFSPIRKSHFCSLHKILKEGTISQRKDFNRLKLNKGKIYTSTSAKNSQALDYSPALCSKYAPSSNCEDRSRKLVMESLIFMRSFLIRPSP